jgi:hypothetical protein
VRNIGTAPYIKGNLGYWGHEGQGERVNSASYKLWEGNTENNWDTKALQVVRFNCS